MQRFASSQCLRWVWLGKMVGGLVIRRVPHFERKPYVLIDRALSNIKWVGTFWEITPAKENEEREIEGSCHMSMRTGRSVKALACLFSCHNTLIMCKFINCLQHPCFSTGTYSLVIYKHYRRFIDSMVVLFYETERAIIISPSHRFFRPPYGAFCKGCFLE